MPVSGKRKTAPPARKRVRRGNEEDAQQLRGELIDAAMKLFAQGGLEAVSMRAVAAQVGVSAMAPYRYFADKAELLSELWQFVIRAVCDQMAVAIARSRGGRARQRASLVTFLDYWEAHPDHYRLVYMTDQTTRRETSPHLVQAPVYGEILQLVQGVTEDLAREIGADMTHAKLAGDIRFAMQLGCLQATLVNQRYPWSERNRFRAAYVEQIIATMERCLLHGPDPDPRGGR